MISDRKVKEIREKKKKKDFKEEKTSTPFFSNSPR